MKLSASPRLTLFPPKRSASVPGQEAEPAEGGFLCAEGAEECGALSESLAQLRSPSVMEIREKGNERLKEELAKAQRVGRTQAQCPPPP